MGEALNGMLHYRIKRLEDKADAVDNHEKRLTKTETDVGHLLRAVSALTKAIWGAVVSMLLLFATFFVWFVQTYV